MKYQYEKAGNGITAMGFVLTVLGVGAILIPLVRSIGIGVTIMGAALLAIGAVVIPLSKSNPNPPEQK